MLVGRYAAGLVVVGFCRTIFEGNTRRTLKDYAEYTALVREYARARPLAEAVEKAVDNCISRGVLAEFLKKNRTEAIKVSIYEYDEERHMRQTKEEGFEEGYESGLAEGQKIGFNKGREIFKQIILLRRAGKTHEEIAEQCGVSVLVAVHSNEPKFIPDCLRQWNFGMYVSGFCHIRAKTLRGIVLYEQLPVLPSNIPEFRQSTDECMYLKALYCLKRNLTDIKIKGVAKQEIITWDAALFLM